MANNIDAVFPEQWSRNMQAKHFQIDQFRDIVSMREEAVLRVGDVVHRPYRSNIVADDLTSEGGYSRQDVSDTDESLTVDQEKNVAIYIKDIDRVQSQYDIAKAFAEDEAFALSNKINGDVLGEVANASNTVDDGDLGGTAGNGIVLTDANVSDVFLAATEKLDRRNAPQEGRFAVLSPQFIRILKSALVSRETNWGDSVGLNGYVGEYDGYKIYKSNAVYSSYVLSLVTTPTNTDTVTLNLPDTEGTRTTITFTFVTTIGSTAGNVLIGGSADVARANLAALINTPGTTTANGVALTAANQNLLKGVTAANDNSLDTLTLTAKGKGFVVVGETLTDATDTWTAETQLQHNMFGVTGAIDLVIQVKPNTIVKPRDGFIGADIVAWTTYGLKTFTEGARRLVNVKMRANLLTA